MHFLFFSPSTTFCSMGTTSVFYCTHYNRIRSLQRHLFPLRTTSLPSPLRTTSLPRSLTVTATTKMAATARPPPTERVTDDVASTAAALIEDCKRRAAFKAVNDHLDPSYRYVGIGSGSTIVYIVDAISKLPRDTISKMAFVSTGSQSEQVIKDAELPIIEFGDLPTDQLLDVYFDGADEVDPALNLIKGGGACLWREKILATSSKKFVCAADFRKISPALGTKWTQGIPVEVGRNAVNLVLTQLEKLGSVNPKVRRYGPGYPGNLQKVVTDNGMYIVDAPFKPLLATKVPEGKKDGEDGVWTVDGLADRLTKIVGVCEHGLFCGKSGLEVESGAQKPVAVYFGMKDGTVKVQTPEKGLM